MVSIIIIIIKTRQHQQQQHRHRLKNIVLISMLIIIICLCVHRLGTTHRDYILQVEIASCNARVRFITQLLCRDTRITVADGFAIV